MDWHSITTNNQNHPVAKRRPYVCDYPPQGRHPIDGSYVFVSYSNKQWVIGKGKGHPRTGHEGPEGN